MDAFVHAFLCESKEYSGNIGFENLNIYKAKITMHNPNDGHVQALLTYRGQVKIEVGGKLVRVGDNAPGVGDNHF